MNTTRPRLRRGGHAFARLTTALVLTIATLALSVPAGHAASIEEVESFGSNPGNLRMFRYVPEGLPQNRPLVIALHGCTQNATDYGTRTGWVQLAEQHQFALLLPEQKSLNNGNRCFNWFRSGDTTRGQGEVASITRMRQKMVDDLGIDPQRVYVTGLSAGGAMTAAMLATHPEQYAGGGIVAGLPYRCADALFEAYGCMNPGQDRSPRAWGDLVRAANSYSGPWPTVSIWHGDADTTVVPLNQQELAEQWTNVHGTDARADVTDTVGGYPHAVYRDDSSRTVVQTYTITGMGHGQPVDPASGCGSSASYILDVGLCAAGQMARTWNLTA